MNPIPAPVCFVALAAILALPVGARAVDEGFDRYAVILSRKPFGDAPVEEPPPPAPAPAAESFARALRVCSITKPEGEGPIRVGIVDKAANNAVYMLREGEESPQGIRLVSANLAEEEAVLQKGDEIALLKLGQEPVTPLSGQEAANRRAAPADAASYAERRRQRREALLEQAAQGNAAIERPPPKYTGEELRKHLQEYNLEAIRQGLPALPIELTPEQDLQLVREGVLPPPDGMSLPEPAPEPAPAPEAPRFAAPARQTPPAARNLIDSLPPELRDLQIEDLSAEELEMLLQ